MIDNLFIEISVILLFALVISGVMKFFKQPLLIGYILTGILLSPYFLDLVQSREAIEAFAEIGVAVLLFLVGIHLNPKIIKDVGKISLITGLGQVIFTSVIGFLIVYLIGFSFIESVYIAIALTFSSTIIIMKLLSDKGDMDTLYGKIAVGFLIVQDLVAMILLMIISTSGAGGTLTQILFETFIIGGIIIAVFLMFGYYILPSIMNKIAKNSEFLLLFSISWCMIAATIFYIMNFSIEVGALLAGITLSMSPYRHQISSNLKPMRDFFIFMFFIFLGSQMVFEGISQYIWAIIGLSLFILIGNVLIVLLLMTRLGYQSKTGFYAGLTVAQISEFSLILIALGVSVGDLSGEILSFVTIIGIITISVSTYMILYSKQIYPKVSWLIKWLEKKDAVKEKRDEKHKTDIILIGCHRIGHQLLPELQKLGEVLVIDHNPETVKVLKEKGVRTYYGDATDVEFQNELNIQKAKMAISTIPDLQINNNLIKEFKKRNSNIIFLASSRHSDDTLNMYRNGADYVLMPYYLGGKKLSEMTLKNKYNKTKYNKTKKEHVEELINRVNSEIDLIHRK